MNESSESSIEPTDDERPTINLQELGVDALLKMSEEEEEELLFETRFNDAQLRELWDRRDELNNGSFRLLMSCLYDREFDSMCSDHPKKDLKCPLSGMEPNVNVSGGYFSFIDTLEIHCVPIHDSVVKDLLKLAIRVGAEIEDIDITNCDREILFSSLLSINDDSVSFEDNIGVMDDELNSIGKITGYLGNLLVHPVIDRSSDLKSVKVTIKTPERIRIATIQLSEEVRSKVEEVIEEPKEDPKPVTLETFKCPPKPL